MSRIHMMSGYLHGFTEEEQKRLRDQASFIAPFIYPGIDFRNCHRILEIGCGVGAQTAILLKLFPQLHVTCVDTNEDQLAASAENLAQLPFAKGRYSLLKQDAHQLDFPDGFFDGVFICWVLEHVSDPIRVLREIHRVLGPGGLLFANEVMNSSFFIHPHCDSLWNYWQAYNLFQKANGGDPHIGPKLGGFLADAGLSQINTSPKWLHYDQRRPEERRKALDYWRALLLSGQNQLLQANLIPPHLPEKVALDFLHLESTKDAVICYAFIQATAVKS